MFALATVECLSQHRQDMTGRAAAGNRQRFGHGAGAAGEDQQARNNAKQTQTNLWQRIEIATGKSADQLFVVTRQTVSPKTDEFSI